ncbi:hypothetical protein [Wolbachia endosymbiont of Atemnus politus]|uniref:hypothetical protein n=1 Tax=Wolbachia endosymbiont of Atemnus politus TaxID=2682840 RepID=UPI001573017A|nr:hypothetical protein [Wolbachia endosymbiont of Atemnus politus]
MYNVGSFIRGVYDNLTSLKKKLQDIVTDKKLQDVLDSKGIKLINDYISNIKGKKREIR